MIRSDGCASSLTQADIKTAILMGWGMQHWSLHQIWKLLIRTSARAYPDPNKPSIMVTHASDGVWALCCLRRELVEKEWVDTTAVPELTQDKSASSDQSCWWWYRLWSISDCTFSTIKSLKWLQNYRNAGDPVAWNYFEVCHQVGNLYSNTITVTDRNHNSPQQLHNLQ